MFSVDLAALTQDSFCRISKRKVPTVAILKAGFDICDTGKHMKEHIRVCTERALCAKLISELENNQIEDRSYYLNYKRVMNDAMEFCLHGALHFVFHFAENVLFPHFLRKLGTCTLLLVQNLIFLVRWSATSTSAIGSALLTDTGQVENC